MPNYKYITAKEVTDRYHKTLAGIRSGRVNSAILETITVEAYGSRMHFHELATITVPEPGQLLITPFDKSLISAMSKAIQDSNLGVTPMDDGAGLRLTFPPLTEETRKVRVKEVHKLQEDAKIEIRLKRQDLMKAKKKEEDDGLISETELGIFEKELQAEVDNLNKEVETITKEKEEELMKI
ncbi:MAG: ribosome recycling factor [bacterium]